MAISKSLLQSDQAGSTEATQRVSTRINAESDDATRGQEQAIVDRALKRGQRWAHNHELAEECSKEVSYCY
jgi:hypothetical protein